MNKRSFRCLLEKETEYHPSYQEEALSCVCLAQLEVKKKSESSTLNVISRRLPGFWMCLPFPHISMASLPDRYVKENQRIREACHLACWVTPTHGNIEILFNCSKQKLKEQSGLVWKTESADITGASQRILLVVTPIIIACQLITTEWMKYGVYPSAVWSQI